MRPQLVYGTGSFTIPKPYGQSVVYTLHGCTFTVCKGTKCMCQRKARFNGELGVEGVHTYQGGEHLPYELRVHAQHPIHELPQHLVEGVPQVDVGGVRLSIGDETGAVFNEYAFGHRGQGWVGLPNTPRWHATTTSPKTAILSVG